MQQLVLMIHILLCLALVALVLLQQGKGANMGPAFGSGASNTLFGSRGPASFLMKLTGTIAALFFVTSLALSFFIAQSVRHSSDLTVLPSSQSVSQSQNQHGGANTAVPNSSENNLAPVSMPAVPAGKSSQGAK